VSYTVAFNLISSVLSAPKYPLSETNSIPKLPSAPAALAEMNLGVNLLFAYLGVIASAFSYT
jgi:hypothetical protein